MEREEFKVLVKSMKAVYAQPTFIPDQDAFNVWYALLKDLPYKIASMAVQKHMLTEKFPPTIADLRAKASESMERQAEEMSELEAWHLVRKAIRNSGYHSEEEFAKLPDACRRAVGSPQNLREWALMESEQVETVEQSHFVRNYRTIVKRFSEDNKLPESFRRLIEETRAEYEQLTAQSQPVLDTKEEKQEEETGNYGMSEETKRKLDEMLRGIRQR